MGTRRAKRLMRLHGQRPLRKTPKPSSSRTGKSISETTDSSRVDASGRDEVRLWMVDSDDSIKVSKDNLIMGNYHVSALYTHQAVEKALKAAIIALKHKIPPKTHNLRTLYSEVADEIVLTDEQKDFLGELTPASQVARYVDVAVGLPRDVYSKRLVEEYLSKALPIIDAVKARVTKASQT